MLRASGLRHHANDRQKPTSATPLRSVACSLPWYASRARCAHSSLGTSEDQWQVLAERVGVDGMAAESYVPVGSDQVQGGAGDAVGGAELAFGVLHHGRNERPGRGHPD
jgi:hypothetical protein